MSEAMKKVEKLIAYRERERDEVSARVAVARNVRDNCEDVANEATQQLEDEEERARSGVGVAIDPLDFGLTVECVKSAKQHLAVRESELEKAEQELNAKTEELMDAHRRVRQMEQMATTLKSREQKKAAGREQREIDDLAVTRGKTK